MPVELIKDIIKSEVAKEKFYSQYGTCKDVDKNKRTCTFVPAGDDAERFDIRLQALMDSDKGFVMIPVEGSNIAVTFVNKSTGFVSLTEDIEEIIYQGGNNGGLVNIQPLIEKINNLENKVNELISHSSTHTHIVSSFGSPSTTPVPVVSGVITPTLKKELEDDKFKH